jgi:hypothetical protein
VLIRLHTRLASALTGLGAALLATASCTNAPPAPSSGAPDGAPGTDVIAVRGTERLAWSQAGDVTTLRFRAYVDDVPVLLDGAVCDSSTPEAECSSPLPPMTDGVHTISLTSVTTSEDESGRSGRLVVEKRSGRAPTMASLPDAARGAAVTLQAHTTFQLSEGLAFTADIVARNIGAPAQLAWVPDGRLLVAEADGGVRVVRPGAAGRTVRAIDTGRPRPLLGSAATGPLGLAPHPVFARNGFVYAALLVADRPDLYHLRVVRLREVGDTLGDPATLFETSVIDRRVAPGTARPRQARPLEAPRTAFGPDGLLYVALPQGFTFYREPAASTPHASMVRLSDDGRPEGALTGIRAHPLGFTWDPVTGVFLPAFADGSNFAVVEPVAQARTTLARNVARLRLPVTYRTAGLSSALVLGDASTARGHELTRALVGVRDTAPRRSIRLTMPVVIGDLADRIGDIAAGADGTWFVVTSNAARAGGTGSDNGDVIVRLAPVR